MGRSELTDEHWTRIEPLLPPQPRIGCPRVDDRKVIEGILYVLRTGCRWQDMPREYGAYVTAWRRLRRWGDEGVWERIWQALLGTLDEEGKIEWTRAFLDGSFVPAKGGHRDRWGGNPAWSRSLGSEPRRDQARGGHDGASSCTTAAGAPSEAPPAPDR